MNIKRLFVALYRALYCLNEECTDKAMEKFLSDCAPYIFIDRFSADPALQEEFEKFLPQNVDYSNFDSLYSCVYDYLKTHTSFSDRFTQISKDEWNMLCMIVDNECNDENVLI